MTNKHSLEEIELRAYEIYLERGGEEGNELEHWLAAERELTERDSQAQASSASLPSAKKASAAVGGQQRTSASQRG
jgi:Protein of unknown function (DUF2934)